MSDTPGFRRDEARAAGIPAAAALLAGSVLLSRVLGFARESLLAYQLGASGQADAYYAAFQLPDLLNYLLAGGALSIAFLPLYTRIRTDQGEAAADRLLATVLGTLGAIAALVTVAMWFGADALVALQFPRFDPEKRALTAHLTRIVLPAQLFFLAGGVIQVPLLARGRFVAAAVAPLFYNGSIIAAGLLLAPRIGVEGFSWGALVGAVLGPFLVPWFDARRRVRVWLRVAPLDPMFLRYLLVAAPLMFGQTLLTVDEWYDRWFGGLLGDGVIAHLAYARKLMQVPVAVVGQAIGAAALPTLAALYASGKRVELDRVVLVALQAGVALALLAAAGAFAFAEPLVQLLYQHGAFNGADAREVARLLAVFALAVPAWVAQQIASRAFYARGDTWRPMALGTAVAVLAIPLYAAFGRRYGAFGLAMAGALGMSANALATVLLARRFHGGPALGPLWNSSARAAAVAIAAGATGHALVRGDPGTLGAARDLALGGAAFGAVAGVAIALFGDDSLRGAVRRIVQRSIRRRP